MNIKLGLKTGLIFIFSLMLLMLASLAFADGVKYLYDDIGQLKKVVDEDGNVATYNYDALGNLTSITRSTGGIQPPEITDITPLTAAVGTSIAVTINGNNFLGAAVTTTTSEIIVTDISASETVIKATFDISFLAPTGLTTVTVTTPFGSASTTINLVPAPPTITDITPNSGPPTRFVTIEGTAFSPVLVENVVSFNGTIATVLYSDVFKIYTRVPAGATTGLVTVTTNGLASNGFTFAVTTPTGAPPSITSITPNFGSVDGGTRIAVAGDGFISGTTLNIGGSMATNISVQSANTLLATTPSGTEGFVDILISNANGDFFLANGFKYYTGPPLTLSSINPISGLMNTPINSSVAALFSRPVKQSTINTSSFSLILVGPSTQVPGAFSFDSGDTVVIFNPDENLLPDTQYVWSLKQNIESIDDIPLDKALSGSFTTAGSVDTVSPKVYVSPANGAANVPTNSTIMLTFSEPINPILVNSNTLTVSNQGVQKSGVVSVGTGNTVITFTPLSNFSPNSQVDITLSRKITDVAGNAIVGNGGAGTDFTSSFTTAGGSDLFPPRVQTINPPNNSFGINQSTSITVTFTEPVNPNSVNSNTFVVSSGTTVYTGVINFSNNNTTATFVPDQPLPSFSIINVTLTTGITDVAGNALTSAFTSTFTTQVAQDNFRPSVVGVSPYNGQTGVAVNTPVRIEFDERINPLTVNSSTFYLYCNGCVSPTGSISAASDGLSATFTPDNTLLPNTSYYIFYTTGIKDIAGNPLLNPASWSIAFTTGSGVQDTTPPQVVQTSPAMGATGVPVNAAVTIQFTEALDGTSVDGQSIVVTKGGVLVDGKITLEQGNTVVRFIPANLYYFDPNTFYEVTVTTAVRDTAGNNLALPYNSSFTTGGNTDTTAPTVVSVSPANWSSNVPVGSNISVTFSEPVNPITINANNFRAIYSTDLAGSLSISADGKTVTFDPVYPLIAGGTNTGNYHYTYLSNIEDLSGNKIAAAYYLYFRTALAVGTDYSSLPTGATVAANPNQLFADGESTTTVTISNINVNGNLVANGTKIAVTVEPVFNSNSEGGEVLGGTQSSIDPRFKVFTTIGGSITVAYRSPDLPDMPAGGYKRSYLQVVSIDAAESPVQQIGSSYINLYRGYSASIYRNPTSMLANGTSWAQVRATIYDMNSIPVPAGINIGVTAESVFQSSSGGVINGGEAASDARFKIFTTVSGGIIEFTYTAPFMESNQSGRVYIQLTQIGSNGQIRDFIGSTYINLNGSSGYTAPQPEIVEYSPANGQSTVGLNAPVVVSFSQPLDPATVNDSNFRISGPSGNVSGMRTLSNGNTVVTFTPASQWVPNSVYYVYVYTGIKSADGNPLLSSLYTSFSTGNASDTDAPTVISISPPDGVSSVATNSSISVLFSEYMNPSSITTNTFTVSAGGNTISGRVVKESYTTYTFIPDTLLAPNTEYTVALTTAITDVAGNALASAFSSVFTTQVSQDNFRPSVVGVSPVSGSTNVPVDTSVTITFSEPMNPITINSNTCYLSGPGGKVNAAIALSGGNTVVTITPVQPLFAGNRYDLYISASIKDIANNSLVNSIYSYFTTSINGNTSSLPTGASVVVNPPQLFANGQIATTIIISNINKNGVPVPNGTIIGVTAEPAFNQNSVGGIISGNSVGVSPDGRFILFSTLGAGVTLSYTPPDLDWIKPSSTASGIIQIASVDMDNRPVNLIAQGTATLFRINSTQITANPGTLPADGTSESIITVVVKDYLGDLVPDGTMIGLTAAPIYNSTTAGGAIVGGTTSVADSRIQIFTTTGGQFTATYRTPVLTSSGTGVIQAISMNNDGVPTGLINTKNISLTKP